MDGKTWTYYAPLWCLQWPLFHTCTVALVRNFISIIAGVSSKAYFLKVTHIGRQIFRRHNSTSWSSNIDWHIFDGAFHWKIINYVMRKSRYRDRFPIVITRQLTTATWLKSWRLTGEELIIAVINIFYYRLLNLCRSKNETSFRKCYLPYIQITRIKEKNKKNGLAWISIYFVENWNYCCCFVVINPSAF